MTNTTKNFTGIPDLVENTFNNTLVTVTAITGKNFV